MLLQIAQRNQLRELTDQTRRLSSASVESVTHLGGELKAIDERLRRIEDELAAQGRALKDLESRGAQDADEVSSERQTG